MKDKNFSQYAKMYLVHVQVARPITTRNREAYLKTWSTKLVTEIKNIVFGPYFAGLARLNA